MTEKLYSEWTPMLAWCDICTHWLPEQRVEGRECQTCRETRNFYEQRFLEALAQVQ